MAGTSPIGYIILTLALIAAICLGTAAVEAYAKWQAARQRDDWRTRSGADHV